MDKLDPKLKRLISAHAAGQIRPNADNPAKLVHVYVAAADGDLSGLTSAGYDLISELAGSAIVILPIEKIEELAERDDVIGVYAPPVGESRAGEVAHSVDQKSVRLVQAHKVKSTARPNGTRGEGVAVGIVDTGVNVLHDAFRTPEGKTRIAFLWAQDDTIRPGGVGAGDLWDRMGKVFTAGDIDALITADPSGASFPAALLDSDGHGTEVASVAAGSEWPQRPPATKVHTGVAPDAQLIVVAGQVDDLAGIEFCFKKADAISPAALPCVVNLSQGGHQLPHNGRSAFDARVNALLTATAGRVLVKAAGNEGMAHGHARVALPHPGSITLDIVVGPEQSNLGCLISGSKSPAVLATIAPPLRRRGEAPSFLKHGDVHFVAGQERHAVSVQAPGLTSDPDWHLSLLVEARGDVLDEHNWYVTAGTWQLKLETVSGPQPVIDVWLKGFHYKDNQKIRPLAGSTPAKEEALDTDAKWRRPSDWINYSLSSEACGRDGIVVGFAGVHRQTSAIWFPLRMSSRGPTTDASVPPLEWKPDLVAPGLGVLAAKWTRPRSAAHTGRSGSTVASGSSIAAPFVTGTVALMLSHDASLKHTDVLKALKISAVALPADPKVRAWMIKYDVGDPTVMGWGLVNAEDAVQSVSDLPPP